MSVSSHLTPQPEQRLWMLLESARHAAEWSEVKIGALTAFAAAEAAALAAAGPAGLAGRLALVLLAAALPVGVLGFSPLTGKPRWLPLQPVPKDKPRSADCLISVEDIARYTQAELIARLDWYLGGGITATQYYEDLVGQTLIHARLAMRKQALFWACCLLVGAAQLCVAARLLAR